MRQSALVCLCYEEVSQLGSALLSDPLEPFRQFGTDRAMDCAKLSFPKTPLEVLPRSDKLVPLGTLAELRTVKGLYLFIRRKRQGDEPRSMRSPKFRTRSLRPQAGTRAQAGDAAAAPDDHFDGKGRLIDPLPTRHEGGKLFPHSGKIVEVLQRVPRTRPAPLRPPGHFNVPGVSAAGGNIPSHSHGTDCAGAHGEGVSREGANV